LLPAIYAIIIIMEQRFSASKSSTPSEIVVDVEKKRKNMPLHTFLILYKIIK
jgi:hypothetical protein